MNDRAGAAPGHRGEWSDMQLAQAADDTAWPHVPEDTEQETRSGARIFAAVLVVAALLWIGFAIYVAVGRLGAAAMQPGEALLLAAAASAPLILLGLLWLIFGRTPRREAQQFSRAVSGMNREAQALDMVLQIVTTRLDEHRLRVAEEATRLMGLGDEASDRLGRVTHYLARETAELDRKAQALESAAANARVDIGVLLSDLPRAEADAAAVAAAMRQAGLAAHEQAAALEAQLSALQARAREADEAAGGAAQRLNAQLARVETSAGTAADRLDAAAGHISSTVDEALERASVAIEETRSAVDAQNGAVLAMIEQNRAAFQEAGADAGRRIAEHLGAIGHQVEEIAARLGDQSNASKALLGAIESKVVELDRQFTTLANAGTTTHQHLTQGADSVRAAVQALQREVEAGHQGAGELTDRTHQMAEALAQLSAQLREDVPAALRAVEDQSARTAAAAREAVEPAEAIQAAAALAAEGLNESEASIARQRAEAEALLTTARSGMERLHEQAVQLASALRENEAVTARLTADAGPELVEALLRVREAAAQAANHAREAIAATIPSSAAALAEAAHDAVSEAVTEPVRVQIASLGIAADQATAVARRASERLTRQLLVIGETAAAIEARMAEDKAEREQKESEALSRRVALLIESLNSTAIDVTKILSNEVTDTAWTAYLKGDRGVFTRRAVRLLDSGEAREIQRHYQEEPEFRAQVNRYIHDFEALLRRVLADPEGSTLGITLLSSDMGKLYVALAQAIDRLRR